MVAKVITGKTIRGVLSYNENKVKEGTAACIEAQGFAVGVGRLSFNDKLQTFFDYQLMNANVRTNAVHISLNFDRSDKLDDEKLREISSSYLSKIGFGDQPYLIYRHFDAAHPHIHLVTTNVRIDGSRIDLHNIGRHRSEQARKEVELTFGLTKAQGRKNAGDFVKAADLTKATYGKSETKRSISNIVNAVIRAYKFTSIHELNAVLKQYNVVADPGREGSQIRLRNGLRYSLLSKDGKAIGVPIKASSIYGKPTLKSLSSQFELNEFLRLPHVDRLRGIIDAYDFDKSKAFTDFVQHLVANGVYTVLRQNDEGRLYGLTFIDNKTRCVFNGSALGKAYSAKGIMDRFHTDQELSAAKIPSFPVNEARESGTLINEVAVVAQPEMGMLKDLMEARTDYSNTPYELRRRKKRRGRSI
jgi:hypothetical protein